MVLYTKSAEETVELGKTFSGRLKKGDTVGFTGELGSGKTTMIKGIVHCLTGKNATSPTFVMVHEYRGRIPVFHFDLYRLGSDAELETIGWEEYLGKGIILVEWADKIKDVLPEKTIFVKFSVIDSTRRIAISGMKHPLVFPPGR